MSLPKKKHCPRCEKTKPASEFGRRKRRGRIELQSKCRPCYSAYHREYRGARPSVQERYRNQVRRRKKELKTWVNEVKGATPCTDCGQQFPWWVMHFDHLPGSKKLGDINTLRHRGSPRLLKEEMAKCEVVCANCHANRTYWRTHKKKIMPLSTR